MLTVLDVTPFLYNSLNALWIRKKAQYNRRLDAFSVIIDVIKPYIGDFDTELYTFEDAVRDRKEHGGETQNLTEEGVQMEIDQANQFLGDYLSACHSMYLMFTSEHAERLELLDTQCPKTVQNKDLWDKLEKAMDQYYFLMIQAACDNKRETMLFSYNRKIPWVRARLHEYYDRDEDRWSGESRPQLINELRINVETYIARLHRLSTRV
jgi:hypothetical protein